MLTEIQIENFKAFGSRVTIPLAPITLIFGENSAGKSSILQCLNLLKQTVEARDSNSVLLPRAERGLVDLGSFQDILFDHDLKRTLSIRLTSGAKSGEWRPFRDPRDSGGEFATSIEFSWSRPNLQDEVSLARIELFSQDDHVPLARFEVDPSETMLDFLRMRYRQRSMRDFDRLRIATCSWATTDSTYWQPFFQHARKHRVEILRTLKKEDELEPQELFDTDLEKHDGNKPTGYLERFAELFAKDFDLESFVELAVAFEKSNSVGLDGFTPVVLNNASKDNVSFFFRRSRSNTIEDIDFLPLFAGRLLFGTHRIVAQLEALFPLGPFRRPPERWYVFSGTSPQDVGYRGDLLPALLYRNQSALESTNEWLKKLGIGYELKLQAVGTEVRDLFEVRLRDTRRTESVEVGLSDVGFGISQILPFVVQALSAQEQTITIEQPEVHIHPRLQADLGDLLAECIKEPRQNRFIIETHSEHLVLRMQRLVRQGKLKPEDVSVVYVKHGCDGAKVTRLNLDEEGDFLDDWPGGFFPERLRELGDD